MYESEDTTTRLYVPEVPLFGLYPNARAAGRVVFLYTLGQLSSIGARICFVAGLCHRRGSSSAKVPMNVSDEEADHV